MLMKTKEVDVETQDGETRKYILSKFDAISGREIVTQYLTSAAPRIGDYRLNEELMLKLMAFVAVDMPNGLLALNSKTLVFNHVPDWETLLKLEALMMEHNCSFFQNGKTSSFLESIEAKAQAFAMSMWKALSAQSSAQEKQHSTS